MSQTALLDRRRDAARKLAVSESQILKWERDGLLHPIRVPGIRAVRYDASEVEALAKRWIVNSIASNSAHKQSGNEDA
jgi:predicted site-specific integrase-resolvase